jgi:hypothetical protein
MSVRAIAICIGLLGAAPALAQTAPPTREPPAPSVTPPAIPPPAESDDARYSFNRVEDGYLRLDTRTGQVSLCGRRQVGWACQVIPDDRIVLESEMTRLQAENGALKKQLLSRGIPLPSGVRPPPAPEKPETAPKSWESDFDRVVTMVEAMWRRLVEMIANLQRDIMKKS